MDTRQLRLRAECASQGEHEVWIAGHGGRTGHPFVETVQRASNGDLYGAECWSPDLDDAEPTNIRCEANAAFMAAWSPATALKLLDRLEAVERALGEACDLAAKYGLHSRDLLVNPELRARIAELREAGKMI